MADLIEEIDDDLRAERMRAQAKRAAPLVVAVLVAIGIAVAIWQVLEWQARKRAEAASAAYFQAMQLGDQPAPPQGGVPPGAKAGFAAIENASGDPHGIRTLAAFRVAGLDDAAGDAKGAIAQLDAIAADATAAPNWRSLASLLSVEHQIGTGDGDALIARLKPLQAPGGTYRALAIEAEAMIDLGRGRTSEAKALLGEVVASAEAGQAIRTRDQTLLQAIGAGSAPPEAGGAPATPPAANARGAAPIVTPSAKGLAR